MKKFKFILVLFLALSFIVVSCTPRQVVLTPEQETNRAYFEQKDKHTQAVKSFTAKLTKYNSWCADQEYMEACGKVDIFWQKANQALDTWGSIIDAGKPVGDSEDTYMENLKELKTALLKELPNYIW